MGDSNISWTDKVWNPVVGCSRVSAGCERCYAETFAARLEAMGQARYKGLTVVGENGARWTRQVREVTEALGAPLHWRKPARVFVNSMSDLFHEGLRFEYIAAVFGVMAACPQHTFLVLTKRPERALEFFAWVEERATANGSTPVGICVAQASQKLGVGSPEFMPDLVATWPSWPLSSVHLGVSVEDQANAEKRIPWLLGCPAAVRWISAEPLLGPIVLREEWLHGKFIECKDETSDEETDPCRGCDGVPNDGLRSGDYCGATRGPKLAWSVVGGESGANHRAMDPAWADALVEQCEAARTAAFVKQDSGPKPGKQGRLSDATWARKEFPRVAEVSR